MNYYLNFSFSVLFTLMCFNFTEAQTIEIHGIHPSDGGSVTHLGDTLFVDVDHSFPPIHDEISFQLVLLNLTNTAMEIKGSMIQVCEENEEFEYQYCTSEACYYPPGGSLETSWELPETILIPDEVGLGNITGTFKFNGLKDQDHYRNTVLLRFTDLRSKSIAKEFAVVIHSGQGEGCVPTDINDSEVDHDIRVHPTMVTNGYIFLEISNPSMIPSAVSVSDNQGQTLITKQLRGERHHLIDVSELHTGIYFLTTRFGNDQLMTRKFIVQ